MKGEKDSQIRHIRSVIEFVKRTGGPYEETDDFKQWNLIPGQQIFYNISVGPYSMAHYGVYVGGGKVFEGGLNPKNFLSFVMSSFNPPIELNFLNDYIKRTRRKGAKIFVVETPTDSDKSEIIKRLERVESLLRSRNFWHPIKTNCEAMANYISSGKQFSVQSLKWEGPAILATSLFIASLLALAFLLTRV